MTRFLNIVAILMMLAGIIGLTFPEFHYVENKKVLDVGDIQVHADADRVLSFPQGVCQALLGGGILLLIINTLRAKR